MKTIVLSLGGSLIIPSDNIDINYLKKFRKFILSLVKKKYRVIIVAGGGRVNSKYNKAAQQLARISDEDLHWIGIKATQLNAELLRSIFSQWAFPKVVVNPTTRIKTNKPIIIGAGWLPGCSTDKDAVLLAINFKAKEVINLTDVDYVYDKDPDKHKDAKPIKQISWPEYKKMFGEVVKPRMSSPFDPVATKLACHQGIKVVILNGRKLKNLNNHLSNNKYLGTVIK